MFHVLRGVPKIQSSQFQIFPKLGKGRGGHRISKFSQIQKSPKLPRGGGGGQEQCGLFPLFVTFFNWNASLSMSVQIPWQLTGPCLLKLKFKSIYNLKLLFGIFGIFSTTKYSILNHESKHIKALSVACLNTDSSTNDRRII